MIEEINGSLNQPTVVVEEKKLNRIAELAASTGGALALAVLFISTVIIFLVLGLGFHIPLCIPYSHISVSLLSFSFLSLIFVYLFPCCSYDCLCFCCHGCVVMKLEGTRCSTYPVVETVSCFCKKCFGFGKSHF